MTEALALLPAWAAGGGLGAFFFGGLWWTVRRTVASERPALWMLGSALLRMGVALGGFALVAGGDWRRLLACLLGFLMARMAITRLVRAPHAGEPRCGANPEVRHAP